jgi:hypothetical protein
MKKLALTSILALGMTGAVFAQGEINWGSISFTFFTAQTNTTQLSPLTGLGGGAALTGGSVGNTVAAANSFYYELLYNTSATQVSSPTTLAALDGWLDTGLEGVNNSSSAGRALPTNGGTTEGTVPFTAESSLMLVGWSANLGSTWATASSVLNSPNALASVVGTAFFGETTTGFITPGPNGIAPGATVFGTGTGQIKDLLTPLYPVSVPEPTTLALGAMGVASLLALRRKKA